MSYLLALLRKRINGEEWYHLILVDQVRLGLGQLAALHHFGLFLALKTVIFQLFDIRTKLFFEKSIIMGNINWGFD